MLKFYDIVKQSSGSENESSFFRGRIGDVRYIYAMQNIFNIISISAHAFPLYILS